MRRFVLAAIGILYATVLLVGARPARADVTKDALKQFREGQKHFNLGEFEDALKAFKESYRLKDDPALLFNIGQCQWKLGDVRSAVHSYRSYLRMGNDVPNRAEVQTRIHDLEGRIQAEDAKTAASGPASLPAPAGGAAQPSAVANVPAPSTAPAAAQGALPLAAPPLKTVDEPRITRTEPAPAAERQPLHAKWWFWGAIGAVVAGSIVAALALRPSSPSDPSCPSNVSCLP